MGWDRGGPCFWMGWVKGWDGLGIVKGMSMLV